MKCEICGNPVKGVVLNILPLHQLNGKLDTMACQDCAKISRAYCTKHARPHMGFMDGSTACLHCVEEMLETHKKTSIRDVHRVLDGLSGEQNDILGEVAEASASAFNCTEPEAVIRFIACAAVRKGKKFKEILQEINTKGSILEILSI